MRTRGKKRLISITYAQLAQWTGMAEGSIRNAVHQGRLDPTDIDALMSWVNRRREAQGLPAIGDPRRAPTSHTDPPAATPISSGGYNPIMGGYPNGQGI